jgi:hypothetical protein
MEIAGTRKKDLLLILYHLLSAIAVTYFIKSGDFKSGPCNLGLDLLSFFLATIISIILTLAGVAMVIKSRKNKYFLIINFCVMIVWLGIIFWNSYVGK